MSDTAVLSTEPQTEEEYRAEFRRLLAEVEAMDRQGEETRKDIDRLKEEARLRKVETRAILTSIGVKL